MSLVKNFWTMLSAHIPLKIDIRYPIYIFKKVRPDDSHPWNYAPHCRRGFWCIVLFIPYLHSQKDAKEMLERVIRNFTTRQGRREKIRARGSEITSPIHKMKICESIWDCDSMICMQGFSLSKKDQHFVILYLSQSMIKLFWANIKDENYNFLI